MSLDVQFLPDVNIVCPDCRGSRYARAAYGVKLTNEAEQTASLPQLMEMDVNSALEFCGGMKTVSQRLQTLQQLGLGYLTLGEETPSLSGGEAQRLKLASEIGRTQTDSVFVFDEPSIGLHPLDVQVLLRVFQALLDNGATVVVIEHDLDVIRNADYVIDMGPGGGESGGRVVATGTPEEIRELEEEEELGAYYPDGNPDFATGYSFDDLKKVRRVLVSDDADEKAEREAREVLPSVMGSDIWEAMLDEFEGARERVARLMDKHNV